MALSVILLSSTMTINHIWLPLNTAFVSAAVVSLVIRSWYPEQRRFRRLTFASVVLSVLFLTFLYDNVDGFRPDWLIVTLLVALLFGFRESIERAQFEFTEDAIKLASPAGWRREVARFEDLSAVEVLDKPKAGARVLLLLKQPRPALWGLMKQTNLKVHIAEADVSRFATEVSRHIAFIQAGRI